MQDPKTPDRKGRKISSVRSTPIRPVRTTEPITPGKDGGESGWVRYYDEASGYYYYAKVMWEEPDDWVDHKDVPSEDNIAIGTPIHGQSLRPQMYQPANTRSEGCWNYSLLGLFIVVVLALVLFNTMTLSELVNWRTKSVQDDAGDDRSPKDIRAFFKERPPEPSPKQPHPPPFSPPPPPKVIDPAKNSGQRLGSQDRLPNSHSGWGRNPFQWKRSRPHEIAIGVLVLSNAITFARNQYTWWNSGQPACRPNDEPVSAPEKESTYNCDDPRLNEKEELTLKGIASYFDKDNPPRRSDVIDIEAATTKNRSKGSTPIEVLDCEDGRTFRKRRTYRKSLPPKRTSRSRGRIVD